VPSNLYLPSDACFLFSLHTRGAVIFHSCQDCLLIGQICWKAIAGTLGTRHAASVVLPAPAELQDHGLEMGIELRSSTWQDKA